MKRKFDLNNEDDRNYIITKILKKPLEEKYAIYDTTITLGILDMKLMPCELQDVLIDPNKNEDIWILSLFDSTNHGPSVVINDFVDRLNKGIIDENQFINEVLCEFDIIIITGSFRMPNLSEEDFSIILDGISTQVMAKRNWSYIKDKLSGRLVNTRYWEMMMRNDTSKDNLLIIPSTIEGMSIQVCVPVQNNEFALAVTKGNFHAWGVSVEIVRDQVISNMERMAKFSLKSAKDILSSRFVFDVPGASGLYMLSDNSERSLPSSIILYRDTFDKCYDILHKDFYIIIPGSSGVYLRTADDSSSEEKIKESLLKMKDTAVDTNLSYPEEVSDYVYKYNHLTGKLETLDSENPFDNKKAEKNTTTEKVVNMDEYIKSKQKPTNNGKTLFDF